MATVTINIDTDFTGERSLNIARNSVKSLSTAFMALGPALVPVAAAGTAAVASLASTLGGAAVAAGAFKLAVQPQIEAVKSAADAQDKYNQAVEQYGASSDQAVAAQEELKRQMDGMPAATQETAKAFGGLKSDFKSWSDSLAGDTMPVFTKGIGVLRTILPMLTPIVKGAAKVFGDLMDKIKTKVESKGFENFMKKVADWAVSGLRNTIDGIINLARNVKNFVVSDGFKEFLKMGSEAGGNIGDILKNLAQFAMEFVKAAGPLAGLSFAALGILADVLNAIPTEVLQILAPTIMAIATAMKLWNLGLLAYAAYQNLANMAAMGFPAVWIVGAIAGIIALIVLIATKTTWFQQIWEITWGAIKTAASSTWNFLRDSVFAPIGTFFTETIPGWARAVRDKVSQSWSSLKTKTSELWTSIVDFIRGIPGKAASAISSLGSRVSEIARSAWTSFKTATTQKVNDLLSFVKSVPGKVKSGLGNLGSLLLNAGKDLIRGMINGVKNMAGSLVSAAKGVVGGAINGAKSLLGISSPSKVFHKIGEQTGQGMADGLSSMAGAVASTSEKLAQSAIDSASSVSKSGLSAAVDEMSKAVASGKGLDDDLMVMGGKSSKNLMSNFDGVQKMWDSVMKSIKSGTQGSLTGASRQMLEIIKKLNAGQGGSGWSGFLKNYGLDDKTIAGVMNSGAPTTPNSSVGTGGRSGGDIHITLTIGDKTLGDLIIDPLRKAVRTRGGNVQAVLS